MKSNVRRFKLDALNLVFLITTLALIAQYILFNINLIKAIVWLRIFYIINRIIKLA